MTACPHCRAKVLPDHSECAACGETLPTEDEGPDPLLDRTIADNFRIDELLGVGSMGRVYAARQISLDKPIAIKVLHKHLGMDRKVAKRFHREARAASKLAHPNSLQIIDFGEDEVDGLLYIAMELLDGPDLQTVIEEDHPMSPRRIGEILGQVLSALEEAHHAGIIHRDLKPENVVVIESPSGRAHVKVCDFGIAKLQEAEGGSALTVSGFVCGTPEFMAPEQARGEELDARADLYAAGCMLYQMLTGEMPFKADSALGIITKHLTEEPVPPQRRAPRVQIPQGLARVCAKAMNKDRAARYESAAEMREALDEAIRVLGVTADEPMPPREVADEDADTDPAGAEPGAGTSSSTVVARAVSGQGALWRWAAPLAIVAGAGLLAWVVWGSSGGGASDANGTDTPDPVAEVSDSPEGSELAAHAPQGGEDGLAAGDADAGAPTTDADDAGAPPAQDDDADDRAARRRAQRAARGSSAADRREAPERATSTEDERRRARARARDEAASASADGTSGTEPDPSSDEGDGSDEGETVSPGEQAFAEGRRRFLSNDVPGAIREFERAARLMPGNAQVHKQLGRAYMRTGQVQSGVEAYRNYLDLAPDAPDRAIVEQIIRQRGGG